MPPTKPPPLPPPPRRPLPPPLPRLPPRRLRAWPWVLGLLLAAGAAVAYAGYRAGFESALSVAFGIVVAPGLMAVVILIAVGVKYLEGDD